MTCASCVNKVQTALQNVPGVELARVNLAERSALITGKATPQALVAAVESGLWRRDDPGRNQAS